MPNSRFALHGLAPPYITVCALLFILIYGLCAFFRPLLTPVSTAPFFASLSASRFTRPRKDPSVLQTLRHSIPKCFVATAVVFTICSDLLLTFPFKKVVSKCVHRSVLLSP